MDLADEKLAQVSPTAGVKRPSAFASSPLPQSGRGGDEVRIRLEERDRLSRELHDSTAQLLVVLELQLMRLKRLSRTPNSAAFDTVLADLRATVAELHSEVRAVGSSSHGARALCDDLRAMASEFAERTGVAIHTEIMPLSRKISGQSAHAIYRVAQEALANVSRHSNAKNVIVSLFSNDVSVTLSVGDDGAGFSQAGGFPSGGRGIDNMRTRLREVGGKLTIESSARGALILATIGASA